MNIFIPAPGMIRISFLRSFRVSFALFHWRPGTCIYDSLQSQYLYIPVPYLVAMIL